MLTAEELRRVLSYDPKTGVFTRTVRTSNYVSVGDEAGTIHEVKPGQFYRYIHIGGKKYPTHRLAWLYVHGEWPAGLIDHRDGDGLNNKLSNLRIATQTQNNANMKKRVDNKSGAKGVSWCKSQGRWRAYITCNQRQRHLGYFDDVVTASAAYQKASAKLFGDFARP